jgi:hypothetical protein
MDSNGFSHMNLIKTFFSWILIFFSLIENYTVRVSPTVEQ